MDETIAIEPMGVFFDARAEGYDDYMRYALTEDGFEQFYATLSQPIPATSAPLRILDLGCGTGLELATLFQRVPHAQVTGIDLAAGMMDLLRHRYVAYLPQITLIEASFLSYPFEDRAFDYIISAMSMHHLLREPKVALYRRIHAALKPGGKYIEGDSVVPLAREDEFMEEYESDIATVPPAADGYYHADIPFSLETQRRLLLKAGFHDFELVWQRDPAALWNTAVYVVGK